LFFGESISLFVCCFSNMILNDNGVCFLGVKIF